MPSKPQPKQQTAPLSNNAEEAQRRAREAQALLENPILQEAFRKLEETYTKAFLNTAYDDVAGREKCYRMTYAIQELEGQIQEVINNGKVQTSRVQNTVKGI